MPAMAANWWDQPTVCKKSNPPPHTFWASSTTGANCWGMKYICADALSGGGQDAILIGKNDISKKIKPDYDANILNADCFGARRSGKDGTTVMVDGKYVNVWCAGVLDTADEVTSNGEIKFGTQPNCATLAKNGYVATLVSKKCYGKYYDPNNYFIECSGNNPLPSRIITLNGASLSNTSAPNADALFKTMISVSKTQHEKYFN